MTIATDLVNKSFGDYQAMATLFFDDFMGAQLKNLTHVRGTYPSFYELFPELSDTTRINALEAFVLKTLTLNSQGIDCAPGKAFAQRMDYIATNLGFENAFVVLLHCYHLASFKGYANNAQYIKEKLQNLYEENPDKALSIGSTPIAFNRSLVLPSCSEQLEKNSSNKMQQNSNKWVNILLGVGAALAIAGAGGAYYLNRNFTYVPRTFVTEREQEIEKLKQEKDSYETTATQLTKDLEKLRLEKGSCETSSTQLTKDLEKLRLEKGSCETSSIQLTKDLEKLRLEKGSCETSSTQLTKDLEKLRLEKGSCETSSTQLTKDLEKLRLEKGSCETSSTQLTKDLEKLRLEKGSCETSSTQLTKDLEKLRLEKGSCETSSTQLTKDLEKLKLEKGSCETNPKPLNENGQDPSTTTDNSNKTNWHQEFMDAQSHEADCQEKLEKCKTSAQKNSNTSPIEQIDPKQLDQLTQSNKQLTAENSKLRKDNDKNSNAITNLRAKLDKLNNQKLKDLEQDLIKSKKEVCITYWYKWDAANLFGIQNACGQLDNIK